jgi:tetratricopeptide (TPR) repeat protein
VTDASPGPQALASGVTDSGLVAGRDARLSGTYVSGRDINLQIVRPTPLASGLFQLPPDIEDFTGRQDALQTIRRLLERANEQTTAVVVSAVAGKAGVGKTALAIRAAYQLQRHFPDGQLYVNLRGAEAQRLDPADVLRDFLLELGVARAAIPEQLGQRAARYRSQLADHRVLVVLDNAAEEAQVRPLLPGSPGCAALITSRVRLAGLEAARTIGLDVLQRDQAVDLLAKIAGPDRVAAEPDAAQRIVGLCGELPLAVRIAGAKLASREHWSLGVLAGRLADERDRLDELTVGDLAVRASIALSYQGLGEEERRAFRLLGLLKAPDFQAWVAAALLDNELPQADDLIDRLVQAQMLEVARQVQPGQLYFRFHDLLRVFARECLTREEPAAGQQAALRRALNAHLGLARDAAALLEPGESREPGAEGQPVAWIATIAQRVAADPDAWFDTNRTNLIAAVEQAHDQELLELTWELARSLTYYFKLRTNLVDLQRTQEVWSDWQRTQELALDAARRAGNQHATANALRSLGDVSVQRGRYEEAVSCFSQALELFRSLGDPLGEAWTLLGLGNAYQEENRFDEAAAPLDQALSLFRTLDRRGEAWALEGLGVLHRVQGRLEEARACFEQALPIFRLWRDDRGAVYCVMNLGIMHRDQGRSEDALQYFNQAQQSFQELGDTLGQTFILVNLGHVYRERGDLQEATTSLTAALASFQQLSNIPGQAWTLLNLGMVRHAEGRFDQAVSSFEECLVLFRGDLDHRGEASTLLGLGRVRHEQGRIDDAVACLERSLSIFREVGDQLGQAKALGSYGSVLAGKGDHAAATFLWDEASAIFRRLGTAESIVQAWFPLGR